MRLQAIQSIDAVTPWWVKLLIPILVSSVITFGVSYTKTDKETSNRLVVVETHQADQKERLDRIEKKLDVLLEWGPGLANPRRTTSGSDH